jgi:hypothetical protein
MMRQLSCDNGNESSHEVEEEDRPVSPSSTTLDTPSDSSAGGTESHQPPTRHRRDADNVSPLLRTLRSISTEEEDEASSSGTSSYVVTSTAVTVTTNRDTPEEANVTTTEQFTALEVVSAIEGLTLTGNHAQQIYTTTEASTLAATKMVPTEYFITIEPQNTSVTAHDMVQKMTTDKLHQGQSTEKTQTTGSVSTPVLMSPTDLSTINTAVETSASLGVLNEAKEITISLTEDNITKNNTGEMNMKDDIFLPETVAITIDTYTIRSIVNTTASTSSNESVSTSDDESIKPNIKESPALIKQNTETDQDLKENHRRQFLPAPLRGPSHKTDNQTNENVTKSITDLASTSNNHHDEGELIQPVETEPEVPARPNRGRRLTRPQGHTLYPYFLNRILG